MAATHADVSGAASEPRPLTMATGTLPGGRANPHDSISITRAWLYAAVYDSLTFVDREGKLIPWLAIEWRRESDTVWVLALRPGVTFSDGRPMTAADVVTNLAYLTSPAGKTEPAAPFVASIVSAEAVDDLTVRLSTATPDPVLPQKLSLIRVAALPAGVAMTRDTLTREALGTGPYRISSWAPGKAVLNAVPGAWRRAPTPVLQAVAMPDSPARRSALITGAADIAFAAFFFEDLEDPTLPYNLEPDEIPAVVGLGFNTKADTPLRDARVRRAILHAVDVKTIVDTLFAHRANLAAQPARKEFLGYNPELKPAPYDPGRARVLLKEAGHENGFSFSMALTGGATIWDQVFQLVANDLAKVKIKLSINLMPEAAFAEQLYASGIKDDAYGSAYFAPTFDALDALRLHTCAWPASSYCDPDAQTLHDRALASASLDERIALTRQAMARSHEMAQALFMYESLGLVGYSKRISGFRSDFGFPRYELMTVKD
ncbi:MAG: ABC transporter substrate-binding protein [Rhodospirillaceae bacterium]|nr:ABC transporter substrate-binding protein [Rhodospirillaceae bacterium]